MLLVGAHDGPHWYTTLADVPVMCIGHVMQRESVDNGRCL